MKKSTLWGILAAVIAVWVVSAAVYWDVLVMYLAPQIAIESAFQTVCDDLEARYQESPLPIFLQGYDENGLQTVRLELLTSDGSKSRLKVQADLKHNQIDMEGALPEKPSLGEVCLYLNKDYAAMTSSTLLAGGFYGITYDTFAQDLQSGVNTLESISSHVTWFLPQGQTQKIQEALDDLRASIQKTDEAVQALQKKMSWEISLPAVPEIDMEQIKAAPLALWALRGRTSIQELTLGDRTLPCYRVAYKLEGENAQLVWKLISGDPFPENGRVALTCWMYQKSLVQLEVTASGAGKHISGTLSLGEDSRTDALSLTAATSGGMHLAVRTRREGAWETTSLNGIEYDWNARTGDVVLRLPEHEAARLNLSRVPDGFRVESTQLDKLLNLASLSGHTCTAVITKGAEITPPEFKNLNEWSVNDLLIFLDGVWSVIRPK